MAKYARGQFMPRNPEKYVGRGVPQFRSSWEQAFMTFLDTHPSILSWASESIRVPYRNPLTGKNTTYVPDFLIVYQDKNGTIHGEVIEIKPLKESNIVEAKSRRDKLAVALNMAKWGAANIFCASKGLKFRVLTENQLFAGGK
jgi:hypothetical protein